jgi:hypothetical protein
MILTVMFVLALNNVMLALLGIMPTQVVAILVILKILTAPVVMALVVNVLIVLMVITPISKMVLVLLVNLKAVIPVILLLVIVPLVLAILFSEGENVSLVLKNVGVVTMKLANVKLAARAHV